MKLRLDDRVLQTDLVRTDWIVPIASFAGNRDPGASPPAQHPAAQVSEAADPRKDRSEWYLLALWLVAPDVLGAMELSDLLIGAGSRRRSARQAVDITVDGGGKLEGLFTLRREVNKLKAERDILKKAAAYFAKEAT